MITTKKNNDLQILTFVIDGEIEQSDIDQVFNEIKAQAQDGKVRLLSEIKRVEGLDLDGMKGFLSTMRDKLSLVGDIERYAIVTDLDWMSTVVPVSDFLTPGLPIQVFAESEKQQAINWLKESGDEAYSPGISPIALPDQSDVLGYVINGKLRKEDYQMIDQQMTSLTEQHGKIKLYIEWLNLEGMTPDSLWANMKTEFKHVSSLNKMAMLGSKDWIENLTEAGDFVTPGIDMKFFELGRKQEALNWLTA